MSNATPVTDATFESEVLKADRPVLVDFWAEWCAPCRAIAPVIDAIATENAETLKVVKLDVDDNRQVPSQFGIMSIPTLLLFKDGQAVERVTGFTSKERLLTQLRPHM